MVFHLAQENDVTLVQISTRPRVGHKIDGLSGVARVNDLPAGMRADKAGDASTRLFVAVGGDFADFVHAPVDVGVAGTISTHHADRRNGNVKYGIAIMKEHQRKGYAAEAIRLVLRYYFQELGYHKAIAEVYAFNEPSISLHENLGFKQEGRLRDMIYTGGEHHDVLVFGMLAEEFGAV